MATRTASTSSNNCENTIEPHITKSNGVYPQFAKGLARPALHVANKMVTGETAGLKAVVGNMKGISRPALRPANRTISDEAKGSKASFVKNVTKDGGVKQSGAVVLVPKKDVFVAPVSKSPGVAPMDVSTSSSSTNNLEALTAAFSAQMLDVAAGVEDVDEGDEPYLALVTNYVNDIYDYLHELETDYSVRANYLEGRTVTARMRSILVDWLVQVANKFQLLNETLYLAINTFDRFLQDRNVAKDKLQLVGVTSLFIAGKYEEIYSPQIADFSAITDKAYTTLEIRKMEIVMLKQLNFSLNAPLPLHFLRRDSKAGSVNVTTHALAKYITELTTVEYDMIQYKPSQIAAASLCLSMSLFKKPWTKTLAHYSKYTEHELWPIISKLAKIVLKAESNRFQAVRTKYASSKLLRISTHEVLKGARIKILATAEEQLS